MRRPLSATVLELAAGVAGARRHGIALGVRGLRLDLPIEVALARRPDAVELLADLPRWRWTTAFDPLRGRLRVNLEEGTPE